MRTNLILFLLGIMVSCSSPISFDRNAPSHPDFDSYKTDFTNITGITDKVKNTRIILGDLNLTSDGVSRTLGMCFGMGVPKSFIVIDKNYWDNSTPTSKAFVVYHELGHCVCSLQHTQPSDSWYKPFEEIMFKLGIVKKKLELPDGCPGSLMHPSSFSEYCMLNHFMYYLDDLRESCK